MSDSEIITIMALFHMSHCRDIKFFYVNHIKTHCQKEHTRHRGFHNLTGNLVAGLITYNLAPKKPSLILEIIDLKTVKAIAQIELTLINSKSHKYSQ